MCMNRCLTHIFCFSLFVILTHSLEYRNVETDDSQLQSLQYENDETSDGQTENKVYDLDAMFLKAGSRFDNMLKYRKESAVRKVQFPSLEKYLLDPPPSLYQNSSKCLTDLAYTMQNLMKPWALQMLDSYGKPTSGIMQGNTKWIGDYAECTQVQAPPSLEPNSTAGNFRGKYCTLQWSIALSNFSLDLTSGVCIPSTCSPPEIHSAPGPMAVFSPDETDGSSAATPPFKITGFKCKPTERSLNSGAKVVIGLLSLFFVLTLAGSSITVFKFFKETINWQGATLFISSTENVTAGNKYDSSQNTESDNTVQCQTQAAANGILKTALDFLECFCVFKNGAKILNTKSGEGELLCIHGIRFLSMSWVILGHTYATCIAVITNMTALLNLFNDFAFQIVLQAFFSVDSFFVLSGFLLSYLAMQEFAKEKGGIFWPAFYIHRYVRLTPVYMLVLGFSATVYFYLGSGPFWPDGDYEPICKEYWWWNLLYISNFAGMGRTCMGWSWYLANDMQFFVISPLFLITLRRWPIIGYSLTAVFLGASFLANFFITYHYDLSCGALGMPGKELQMLPIMTRFTTYSDKLYVKPYTRIGPYLIGILLGHLLFKRKSENKPKHSWVFLLVGWTVATSVTLACVYGLYKATLSLVARSIYNAISRTLFAGGLAWVIYVCLIGQGGPVNSILSYKLFIPLSRLTYVAYLVHPMIIGGYFASMKTSMYFTHPTVVYYFLGMLVMSYAVALPVALVLESPVISLEKMVRRLLSKRD